MHTQNEKKNKKIYGRNAFIHFESTKMKNNKKNLTFLQKKKTSSGINKKL